MRFDKQFIDSLRNRISISEVIGKSVNLKHKARGEYLGLCPFHNEKTPSFTVSEQKGFYHCFGCGANGDAIKFLMEHNGLTYPEAVKELALSAGVELPKLSVEDVRKEQKIADSYDVVELATKWFQDNLNKSQGFEAKKYLQDRGITNNTIQKFRIGFVPDEWDGLKKYLASKNIDEQQMMQNGLIAENENKSKKYDRFRGRIIFPIFDSRNRVIAFGGRIIKKESKAPKYLNSSETDLFHKSYVLYGYNFARDVAYKKSQVIAVEGYMDVISLHQAGFENAVAPMGTAVTENHIRLLWKMSETPIFCLDGDNAGIRASKKLAEEFVRYLQPGLSMKFLFLPEGKDPDDFVRKNGSNSFNKMLQGAQNLSDMLWERNLNELNPKTPEDNAKFAAHIDKLVNSIQDAKVKQFYKREYNSRLFSLGFKNESKKKTSFLEAPETKNLSIAKDSEIDVARKELLLMVSYNPKLLVEAEVEEILCELQFSDKRLENLNNYINYYSSLIDAEEKGYEGLIGFLKDKDEQGHIEFLEKNPLKAEYFFGSNDDGEKTVAAWQYLLSKYNSVLAENYLNDLLMDNPSDISKVLTAKKEVENLAKQRDEKRSIYDQILEKDYI